MAPILNDLPNAPEGWCWTSLEAVSNALGGFAFESRRFAPSGYQVLKMANIRMGHIDLSAKPSFIADVDPATVQKYELRNGDLVITLTGTRKKRDYGYVAVVRSATGLLLNQRIARIRPLPGLLSAYLQVAMQSEAFRNRFFSHETGNVGQGNVGMRAVTKEPILLPPFTEQHRIVAEVERRLSVIDEMETALAANHTRAHRLRQSILHRTFTGELLKWQLNVNNRRKHKSPPNSKRNR